MHPKAGHILGRITRFIPNVTRISTQSMRARFFLPSYNHHVGKDLAALRKGNREPRLYSWIDSFADGSVFFDVGTNYGQEVVWASGQRHKTIRVIGFDCSLLSGHFCALNSALNDSKFEFVFAAIGAKSGEMATITSASDTHIPDLHKKNAPYSYQVPMLALDDYIAEHDVHPSHLKIDVDGAENDVIDGAKKALASDTLREIFIEIDHINKGLIDKILAFGFTISWQEDKRHNSEYLLVK